MEADNEPLREGSTGRRYWEIVADQIAADGWSYGFVQYQFPGFEGWKVDAHRAGQKHQVTAENLNTAFLELQTSVRCTEKGESHSS